MADEEIKITKPESKEIATTRDGRDITRGYIDPLMYLPPQDTVLRSLGGNYLVYKEVLRDDQVAATLLQRQLAVVSREWDITPGGTSAQDKAAAEFLRGQLDTIGWDNVTKKMLFGVFYGYAVAECLWARDGSQVVLDQIRVRDRRRFAYDGDMRLRLMTMSNMMPGELLPDRKFWAFGVGADHDDEPYGLGLAHWLYWPVWFKRNGVKFWLIYLEKFGQPTVKGSYQQGATQEERTKLLQAVEAVGTDSGVIMPDGMVIELLEAARSGSADYTELHDRMNAAIAKVVLGQTLTTEAAGGQYKADVQMDVRQDLVKADADLVCESFNNSVARWLTEWNFPGAAVPKVHRKIDEDEDLTSLAARQKNVFDMGFRPTLKQIVTDYGGEWEDIGPPPQNTGFPGAAPFPPAPAFAEGPSPGGRDVVDAQSAKLSSDAQSSIDAMIAQIRALVEQAQSFDDLRANLIKLYPALDEQKIGTLMQQALAASALAGRYDILEQARGG